MSLNRNGRILIASVVMLSLLWACSGKEEGNGAIEDAQFCNCIQVTDKLNKYSAELLERSATAEDEKQMKKLKDARTKACKRYYNMSGEEMLKRKAGCKK